MIRSFLLRPGTPLIAAGVAVLPLAFVGAAGLAHGLYAASGVASIFAGILGNYSNRGGWSQISRALLLTLGVASGFLLLAAVLMQLLGM